MSRRVLWALAVLVWMVPGCGPRVDILDLMQKTRSNDPEIAARAQDTLDRYVLERRVGLFAGALDAGAAEDRELAIWCLGRIGTPEAVEVLAGQLVRERSFPLHLDPVSGVRHLQPSDSRLQVARILRRLGTPPQAVEIAAASLQAAEDQERLVGIYILGLLMDPAGAPYLLPLADDPAPAVARAAVESLGKLRNPVAIPVLVEKGIDPDSPARQTALNALLRYDDPAIVDPVLEAFANEDDIEVRYLMVSLLGRFPDPRVVTALIPALDSDDDNLRRMAESRLCELTHRPPGLPREDWSRWWEQQRGDYQFPP
jgi:HEAT repeat protein